MGWNVLKDGGPWSISRSGQEQGDKRWKISKLNKQNGLSHLLCIKAHFNPWMIHQCNQGVCAHGTRRRASKWHPPAPEPRLLAVLLRTGLLQERGWMSQKYGEFIVNFPQWIHCCLTNHIVYNGGLLMVLGSGGRVVWGVGGMWWFKHRMFQVSNFHSKAVLMVLRQMTVII